MVACTAMKPADLPINLTIPMPLGMLQRASVFADMIAACAASTDVVNPDIITMVMIDDRWSDDQQHHNNNYYHHYKQDLSYIWNNHVKT